ncbi:MAG: Malonyl CoA-acyl carrier protein transacylase [Gemmatimonadetes bacterium]|nr:Malonyl CoA-acyl carrier protein transacylase [Gemmatimonadota bacterium]
MSDVMKRLAELSPEKRRLLELRMKVARSEAAGPAVRPRERTGNRFPLSFSQQRLWVLEELEPGTGFYNIPFPIRMRGPLGVHALERALDALRARHESLRTVFEATDDEPVQVIQPFRPAPLEVEDLSALPAAEREARLRERISEDANAGFDLRAGVMRARLLRVAPEDHVLLFTLHHVAGDGWSMGVVARELGALYEAFAEGRPDPLPPLPVQYADFALWQREHLRGDTLERHLAYWRERLAGVPPVLDLPTDRPRPAVASHRGGTLYFALPAPLADRLRSLAREEGTTLFAVLLAGVRTVLGRLAAQDDFAIGSPVANRTREQVEGLIGFFVNTLALRTDLAGDPSFRGLVRREKETTLAAFAHQDLPFERLVEELRVERDLSRNPLFQACFVLQNAPTDGLRLEGLAIEPEPFDCASAKFDLTISMMETAEGPIAASLEYAADLYDEDTAGRLVGHLHCLLDDAASGPDRPLSRLALAGAEERDRVLAFSGAEREYPRDATVHGLFAQEARARPDAVALVFRGTATTYGQLEGRANRLARHLRAAGVGIGSRVGLSLERSPEVVVVLLAILKAGAAYVPLDPGYPEQRLRGMLADAGVSHLVVESEVPEALDAFTGSVVRLAVVAAEVAAQPSDEMTDVPVGAEDLCYVLYTSGSTGRPKGAAVPHRGVVRLVRNNTFADYGPHQTFIQIAPVAFDASTLEVWSPLLNGGKLAIHPPETPSLEELGRFVEEQGATVLWITAGLFHQLVDTQVERFRGVRVLMSGGDVLSVPHVRKAMLALPDTRLVNGYGPTESTVFTTVHPLTMEDTERAALPIGRPIANTRVYVLDGALQAAPVGVPGEICVGGDGLAVGYLNQPALTADRWIPDAFAAEPGARLYRSGDRGRWTPDGTLEFMGRMDGQVKLRGFRIELGEIEAALTAHPLVREASVIVREDVPGDKRLAAYVVLGAGAPADPRGELRAWLQKRLPEYMVPAAYVPLPALPLNEHGKVDRRALPVPDALSSADARAPRTPTEEVLAGIWEGVLNLDRVGTEDNFFELGGHSLLGTQVVSRVRQVFGVEIPLRVLFEAPRVRELAERIDRAREDGGEPVPAITREPAEGPLPLSFAQERLWFLDQLEPGGSTYNMPFVIDLEGALDVPALAGALNAVVHRHEALRTVFAEVDSAPVQVVRPTEELELEVVSLEGLGPPEQGAAVERLAGEEARRPFDLRRGPVFRARLLRLGEGRHTLLLTLHHVAGDGWSMGVLFREVSALYEARLRRESDALPPLPVQYGDFARWQRRHLAGERLEQQVDWWRRRLEGAPAVLELPTDRPRPPMQSFRGGVHAFLLPADLTAALHALSRREGATLFMTLLAAFQVLLGRYARQEDVVVGTPIAGRNREELEGLIGFFVNTLVLRADLSGDPAFRDLLARVRESTLGAYAHQDLPFERLVEELHVERSLAYTPVFQVMFVLQNAGFDLPVLPGVTLSPREFARDTAKFDLTLSLDEQPEGIVGHLEYAADLFDAATAARIARHYETLLRAVAAHAEAPIHALEMLPEDEEHQVVRGWNRLARRDHYRRDLTLHGMFEAQAARTPDAPALVCGAAALTYRELNARANRLAHYLRSRGVGPEVRVGILMERTEELIVAMYGVLKAGGAYVPLDPAYPAERVAFMLEDTHVPVLLTQQRLVEKLPALAADVFPIDTGWDDLDRFAESDPEPLATPENLAYLIYTSGSTGRPKGIQLEHRSAAIVTQWMRDEFSDDLRRSVLASTSVCFDVSIAEIFGTLSWGGRLVLVKNALSLASLPAGQEVHMASMVPSAAVELLRMKAIPRSLRSINLGGEPVKPALARELHATGHIDQVVNLYGPSEDTTYTTALWIAPDVRRMTVGRPVANTRIYILDRAFRPCAAGVPGELYIGGHGVTRGYHARPSLTAEKYLPDAWGERPGERMYRTGDLARWLPDGEIEYLGRLDHQVKIRGHRVEVGEVEATLAAHPALAESAVVVREDLGLARLVAYYVPADPAPSVSALRTFLRERLPEYMVPSAWVRLPVLPHTPNGKVDKRALPAPDAHAAGDEGYVAPRTPSEQVLASLWAEVLGVERVGLRDNFFELGGHSLLATRVMSRLRESLQVEMPLRAMFDAPTVEALAERVDAARGAGQGAAVVPLVPVDRTLPLPLSFAQERLWFVESLQRGLPVYNMPLVLRMRGPFRADAMRGALERVVARHESLRTTFGRHDGRPVQVVHPAGAFEMPVDDLSALPALERAAEAGRRAEEEAGRLFDLEAGPLLRARVLRLAVEEHHLLLTMHHIVSDGWSVGVLFREAEAAYEAVLRGAEPEFDALPVQYADFAAWQRAWLSGDNVARQLGYWSGKLAGAPTLDLPTDRPRPAVQSHRGSRVLFSVPAEVNGEMAALARRQGSTLFMALLAAFKVLLWRYAGQDDVVVGSPIAGRNRPELEGMIGFFVNTLALRTDLSGDPTFPELLARVRETTLDAYAHQDLPFERLVEELQPERSLSRHPIFQVSFSLQTEPMGVPAVGELRLEPAEGETHTTKFDVVVGLQEVDGGIVGAMEYATDLFDAPTIERLADEYRLLLAGIAADPGRRLSELPRLLEDAERQRVLVEWNRTARELPARPVHRWIALHAAEKPDAVALVHGSNVWTRGDLESHANRLAHLLIARGVTPETRVGLLLDESAERVAALLAVLKAGAAYVPLDPAASDDSIADAVDTLGASVVLADEANAGRLRSIDLPVLVLSREAEALAAQPSTAPSVGPEMDALAAAIPVLAAGGLTDGVLVTHRGLAVLCAGAAERFGLGEASRAMVAGPLGGDLGMRALLPVLSAGAELHLPTGGRAPEERVDALRRGRITHAVLSTAVLAALPAAELPALDVVVAVGGASTAEAAARWRAGRRLVHAYGPAEAASFAVAGDVSTDQRRPAVGRAWQNTRLYVLDAEGRPLPVGVTGELYVGGPALARGYATSAARTAERFAPDPFSGVPGERLFRTGERARWRPDGEVEMLGRVDEMIRIRGLRVEPAEIEAMLVTEPGVRDARIVARPDTAGLPHLVAYVAAGGGVAPTPARLRDHLRERLPEYMVPAAFVVMDAFPLGPDGRVDARALPAPDNVDEHEGFVAPQGDLERRIAALWCELLQVPRVGVHDNFFEIGGHSLLLTRMHERLREELGREVSMIDLFQYPSVAALAEHLEAAAAGGQPTEAPRQSKDRGAARRAMLQRGRR